MYIYIYNTYIHTYLDKSLTTSRCDRSLERWLVRGIIPKWPYFRLVKYYNLSRDVYIYCIYIYTYSKHVFCPTYNSLNGYSTRVFLAPFKTSPDGKPGIHPWKTSDQRWFIVFVSGKNTTDPPHIWREKFDGYLIRTSHIGILFG